MLHVRHRLASDARALGVTLDENKEAVLHRYLELLRDRAIPLGLVSASDADRLYERHLLDCLRACVELTPADRHVLDLGSGAGLPGLVLATALPLTSFVLVDSRRRAAGFLELGVERLGLENVEVRMAPAGDLNVAVDVVTARAFGPIDRSWAAAWPLLRPGGRLIYFAGRRLKDPARMARSPEPPAEVRTAPVIASWPPLVIMSRRG
jgi:16S rRNA (guanine(527)-N(7))-methyltransferase RsmG